MKLNFMLSGRNLASSNASAFSTLNETRLCLSLAELSYPAVRSICKN